MRMRTSATQTLTGMRAACLAMIAALIALGCGKLPPVTAATADTANAEGSRFVAIWPKNAVIPVEIENRHTNDLSIYLVRSGKSQRVGMAVAAKSTYLRLPAYQLGPGNSLTLMAHAIGMSRQLESDRMVVMPGQRVVWTIERGFEYASASVWDQ